MATLNIPDNDQLEITLLGTGGGYGESVVVHLGAGQWLVVDSCKDPKTGSILPLEYLKSIGVNVKTDVKLIVCTHWDDDHINGLSTIFNECEQAKFCISAVTDRHKFLQLVALDYAKFEKPGSLTSTRELMECLSICEKRGLTITQALQDRNIFSSTIGTERIEIFSLSPSDESKKLFDLEISRLISEFGAPSKKLIQSPNQKSVVVFLRFGKHRAILGADLEVTGSIKTGWECVLDSCESIDDKSSYFKISHHGSITAYQADIWNDLLQHQPMATLTPWNKNNRLPQPGMISKYKGHTPNLYITSDIISTSPKKRDSDIEKIIARHKLDIREVRYYKGIIRSRIKISENIWEMKLFDAARKL